MEKFTGIPSSDAIDKNVYKMLSVYDQLGRNVCVCASRNCKKNDNINNHNDIVIHKNSQLICPKSLKSLNINHVSTPLIGPKGNVFASLEIIQNIEHEKQMTDISQLSQAIVHITSLEETIDAILPKIAQSLHSQKAIIAIQHQNSDLISKHFGFEKSQSNKIKLFNYDQTVKIFSNNLQKESAGNSQLAKELKINKIMQSPLVSRDQLFGSIAVINKKIGIFEKKDWRYFKTLTAYITRIIENAIIYQDLSDNLVRERQFIGDIAHEFKTPLTIIKSETELAISRNRSIGYYQKTLESIFSSVNMLSSRLKNVLDLTWSKTLKDEDASEVDVTSLVSDILEIAEKLASAKKIKVESKLNGKVKIMASRDKLTQAILNIIDNAIKYTPSGGKVKLSVGKVNGNVKISISDTGMGIPKSEISRIFDRFYRGLKHDRKLGSGLGLAISKSIVSAYKGQIVTKSKVGKGTSFNLTFPIYKH
jgi:signal transduction histidine kinase